MTSKVNSAVIFLCFNIFIFFLVSIPSLCQTLEATPDSDSASDPISTIEPLLTPDPPSNSKPTSSTPAAQAPSPSCSLDPVKVALCGASLYGGPLTLLLSGNRACCEVLQALDRSEASVCLCPIVKPVSSNIKLDMATLNRLLEVCRVQGPIKVECA